MLPKLRKSSKIGQDQKKLIFGGKTEHEPVSLSDSEISFSFPNFLKS